MCRVHSTEELANILDTMADLFAWKRRRGLAAAAEVARHPSRPWRPAPTPDAAPGPGIAPAPYRPSSRHPRPA